jgi:hypothetical protein
MALKDKIFGKAMTNKQRSEIEMAKVNQKTSKTAISEAGRTARSIVSSIATNRTIQQKLANDAAKKYTNDRGDAIANALKIYENVIKGNPDEQGGSGNASTTQVGGSGSALNS